MGKDHILAIDWGTQSVRALVFDLRGRLVHKVGAPIEPCFPRTEVRDVYEGLYQRVYKRIYRRLRPLCEEIRRITGYPLR